MEKLMYQAIYVWQPRIKGKMMRELRNLKDDESGMGTIEVVLILVVLIALVIIFRKAITELLHNIFEQINTDTESVYNPGTN